MLSMCSLWPYYVLALAELCARSGRIMCSLWPNYVLALWPNYVLALWPSYVLSLSASLGTAKSRNSPHYVEHWPLHNDVFFIIQCILELCAKTT